MMAGIWEEDDMAAKLRKQLAIIAAVIMVLLLTVGTAVPALAAPTADMLVVDNSHRFESFLGPHNIGDSCSSGHSNCSGKVAIGTIILILLRVIVVVTRSADCKTKSRNKMYSVARTETVPNNPSSGKKLESCGNTSPLIQVGVVDYMTP